MIQTKRIYDMPSDDDGYRVLVDRIWPRGVSKDAAQLNAWMKDVTPSTELRVWFGHDPERWEEFKFLYESELQGAAQRACVEELRAKAGEGTVTLLYAAKDDRRNHALVLLDVLRHSEDRS